MYFLFFLFNNFILLILCIVGLQTKPHIFGQPNSIQNFKV